MESYRYLGTEIENRLTGETQYNKLMQTLVLKLGTFSKIRRFLNTKATLTVYKSTVLPLLDHNDHYQFLWNANKLGKLKN